MEKAYDIKDLLKKFEAHGLSMGEDVAKAIIDDVFSWAGESAAMSDSKIDDMVAAFYPKIKAYLLEQADKIDGQVG